MSTDFKIYLVEKPSEPQPVRVLMAVKKAARDLCAGPVISWMPPYPYDPDREFFFRGSEQIWWTRLFYEPLTHIALENLRTNYQNRVKSQKEKMTLLVFFPSLGKGVLESLTAFRNPQLPQSIRFFEFYFLASDGGNGLALRELTSENQVKADARISPTFSSPAEAYHFFKHARLSRNELIELMELGLELKRM